MLELYSDSLDLISKAELQSSAEQTVNLNITDNC